MTSTKKADEDSSESHGGTDTSVDPEETSDDLNDRTKKKEAQSSMARIEKHFTHLKEQVYKCKIKEVEKKMEDIKRGTAEDYKLPLNELTRENFERMKINDRIKQLQHEVIQRKMEAEMKSCGEQFEQDKVLLFNSIRDDIEEKITQVMNNRTPPNLDLNQWICSLGKRRSPISRVLLNKPARVRGPYVVYMLAEQDIVDDISAVRQIVAEKRLVRQRRHLNSVGSSDTRTARFEDGKLFYEGQWFTVGSSVLIDKPGTSPVYAKISAINTGEVWVRRVDDTRTKLYISQLQRGRCTIRHDVRS